MLWYFTVIRYVKCATAVLYLRSLKTLTHALPHYMYAVYSELALRIIKLITKYQNIYETESVVDHPKIIV